MGFDLYLFFGLYLYFLPSLIAQSLKNLPAIQETPVQFPGLSNLQGGSPGEGNGNPLQYSCLENPHGQKSLQATPHGVTRVGHDLVTKPPTPPLVHTCHNSFSSIFET